MTLTGKLDYLDIEGGTWMLRTADGSWVLIGHIPHHLHDQQVVVEGEPASGPGVHMAGRAVQVDRIEPRGGAAS